MPDMLCFFKNHLASREIKRTNCLIVAVAQPECDPDNSTCITVLPVVVVVVVVPVLLRC